MTTNAPAVPNASIPKTFATGGENGMKKIQYRVLLDDVLVVDCCEERMKRLRSEYSMKILTTIENPQHRFYHCLLGCLNKK